MPGRTAAGQTQRLDRSARDAGLRRISAWTGLTAAASVVLAGVTTAAVAAAIPGKQVNSANSASSPVASQPGTAGLPATGDDSGGAAPPVTVPANPAPSQPLAVSGGS